MLCVIRIIFSNCCHRRAACKQGHKFRLRMMPVCHLSTLDWHLKCILHLPMISVFAPPGFASTVTPTASTASWPPKTLPGPQLRAVCSYRALQGQWNCPSSVSLCSWIHSWLRRAGSEMIGNHISSDSPCQLPQSKYRFGNIIYH